MGNLVKVTITLIALFLALTGGMMVSYKWGKRTEDGKEWESKDDRDVAKIIKMILAAAIVFLVSISLCFILFGESIL